MRFALDPEGAKYLIKRYSADSITVNNTDYTCSLKISPNSLLEHWAPQTLADLTEADFAPILELKPDIFILGVGEKHQFPDAALLQPLYKQHIGVEVMSTSAACRTFNVLASDGRAVVAALLRV